MLLKTQKERIILGSTLLSSCYSMSVGITTNSGGGIEDLKQLITSITRKGRITLPAEMRRSLGVQEGDKIAVSLLNVAEGEPPQALIKPARSIAESTFGAVTPRKRPENFEELRRTFEESVAEQVMKEAPSKVE